VQLIGMLHCAPEATLKPKRFKFTLKTVITDVFVAQVYWEAVPKTWPGGSKASVAKCVVCARPQLSLHNFIKCRRCFVIIAMNHHEDSFYEANLPGRCTCVNPNKIPLRILEKGECGRIQGLAKILGVPPIISGTGKATNFKVCTLICSINQKKSP